MRGKMKNGIQHEAECRFGDEDEMLWGFRYRSGDGGGA